MNKIITKIIEACEIQEEHPIDQFNFDMELIEIIGF
jgi:hypothetical protein